MKRDGRLLIALAFFAVSMIACVVQVWTTKLYIDAAVMGSWTWFANTFSVDEPPSGPERFCFDYCVAELPFFAGWVSIGAFSVAWATLAYAWWRPRM